MTWRGFFWRVYDVLVGVGRFCGRQHRWLFAGRRSADMYYNYYATLALFQSCRADEYLWERWNAQMRDHLIQHQTSGGSDDGSWYFNGGVASSSGRLFMTAVAAMTLQVYYRYPAVHADDDPLASVEGVAAVADADSPRD